MKKILAIILMAAICLSLASCAGFVGVSNELVITDDEGNSCINTARFKEIITQVELTEENWNEYIIVYSYEEPENDGAGNIISDKMITHYRLGGGSEKYHAFMHDTTLELKHKETERVETFQLGTSGVGVNESFSLDDYEFVSVTGYLYFIDPPEEVIFELEEGRNAFYVYTKSPINKDLTFKETIKIDTYTNTFFPVEYVDAVYNIPQA